MGDVVQLIQPEVPTLAEMLAAARTLARLKGSNAVYQATQSLGATTADLRTIPVNAWHHFIAVVDEMRIRSAMMGVREWPVHDEDGDEEVDRLLGLDKRQ